MNSTRMLYKVVSTASKKSPPLQRSKVTGLRADNIVDIACIDHAEVKIRGETCSVLIVVDGAATFVTAFCPEYQRES